MEARCLWQNFEEFFLRKINLSSKQSEIESSYTLRETLPRKSSEKEGWKEWNPFFFLSN